MISFGPGRARRTVGLDVGSGLLKVAVVDHSGDEPRLENLAIRTTPPGAMVDGELLDPGVLGDCLEDLFRESGIEPRRLAVSVEGRDVIIRNIQMDRMPAEDARRVIHWEAERYIPFDMKDVRLDFVVADPGREGPEMNVLLVAAKTELVGSRVSWLRERGWEPVIVDVGAFALYNALIRNHPASLAGVTGLVSIGHCRTVVDILDEGTIVMSRELGTGTSWLRDRLIEGLGVRPPEADAAVRGELEVSGLEDAVEEFAGEIARSVERSARYLESRDTFGGSPGLVLGRLWSCGGGSCVPGLVDAVARRLGVEVRVANPLARLSTRAGAMDALDVESSMAVMMQAVGLALRRGS